MLLKSIPPKGIGAIAPYPDTLRVIISDMAIRRTSPSSLDRVEQVMLARLTDNMRPVWFMVGTIEGTVGDKVLVRFGDVVVQLPAEMLVEAGE